MQVLFRYAIAIFKYFEDLLLKQCDYMSIFHTLRNGLEELKDIRKLTQVKHTHILTQIGNANWFLMEIRTFVPTTKVRNLGSDVNLSRAFMIALFALSIGGPK